MVTTASKPAVECRLTHLQQGARWIRAYEQVPWNVDEVEESSDSSFARDGSGLGSQMRTDGISYLRDSRSCAIATPSSADSFQGRTAMPVKIERAGSTGIGYAR
jgi:hypothetical protein